jgi:hypothetical protein
VAASGVGVTSTEAGKGFRGKCSTTPAWAPRERFSEDSASARETKRTRCTPSSAWTRPQVEGEQPEAAERGQRERDEEDGGQPHAPGPPKVPRRLARQEREHAD